MTSIDRIWDGQTVVCMASGPSLTADDCAFVKGRAHAIAVNDAWKLAPWADVLYSSDRPWWTKHRGVPEFAGLKISMGEPYRQFPDIRVLKNAGVKGVELKPDGLKNGRTSGYAAINLAVHFGARRIVLLGYNMGWIGGRSHFFGRHVGLKNEDPAQFLTHYDTIVAPLKALGVDVVNCTPHSRLTVFPMASVREVFAEVAA